MSVVNKVFFLYFCSFNPGYDNAHLAKCLSMNLNLDERDKAIIQEIIAHLISQ
jgi:hypothetical protein